MKAKARWLLAGMVFFLLSASVLVFLFRLPILDACGTFMAPRGEYVADVAILEGTQFIDRGVIACGMELFVSGRVRRIVVVLHHIAPSQRPFALNEDYANLVRNELETLGLTENDFTILVTPIHNPITLTSAKGVMEGLSREGVRSAVVVTQGFRTRRVCLAYQQAGLQGRMEIHPHACFTLYQRDRWWSQGPAIRDFVLELQKLVYYRLRGYIPLRFSASLEPFERFEDQSVQDVIAAP